MCPVWDISSLRTRLLMGLRVAANGLVCQGKSCYKGVKSALDSWRQSRLITSIHNSCPITSSHRTKRTGRLFWTYVTGANTIPNLPSSCILADATQQCRPAVTSPCRKFFPESSLKSRHISGAFAITQANWHAFSPNCAMNFLSATDFLPLALLFLIPACKTRSHSFQKF